MAATENNVINRIVNSALVIEHFGYQPNLHDATPERMNFEIHSFKSTITLLIETAEFTNELDEHGKYMPFKPCRLELQFQNAQDASLSFDHVPVIFGVGFEDASNLINCHFDSSTGSYTIVAEQITVLSLIPTKQ